MRNNEGHLQSVLYWIPQSIEFRRVFFRLLRLFTFSDSKVSSENRFFNEKLCLSVHQKFFVIIHNRNLDNSYIYELRLINYFQLHKSEKVLRTSEENKNSNKV